MSCDTDMLKIVRGAMYDFRLCINETANSDNYYDNTGYIFIL